MADLLLYIAKELVSDPDQVSVETKETESNITLVLHVAKNDMGKVIGKSGKIAKAIRTVIKSASKNSLKPYCVSIV